MQRETRKIIAWAAFFLLVATITMTIGCGGGGGNTGRQVLPGENPVGPGVSPGTDTGTGPTPAPDPDPTPAPAPSPEETCKAGWEAMNDRKYGSAIVYFTNVINDSRSTPEEKERAYMGRGWAKAKDDGVVSGKSDFARGGDLTEARLGYALALIQESTQPSVARAVDVLKEIGLADPQHQLPEMHSSIGVSSASAHAMLAYAYFWRADAGDAEKARDQIIAARAVDKSSFSYVEQIYETLKKAGLTGI